MADRVLTIDSIWKIYQGKNAVQGLSLEIDRGQVVGILGPNGSGKTTTLGMILGAIRPTRGSYQWINPGSSKLLIGSILEKPNFASWLSADDNLRMFGAIKGLRSVASEIPKVLEQVGLSKDRHKKFAFFSLGMKQRLGLAAAMLGNADVYVLDEPTNGVDPEGIADIRQIILNLASQGKTIILASHILDEVEKVCSHVAIMNEGQLLSFGAIDSIVGFADTIEVGSEDMPALEACLQDCPLAKSWEVKKGFYQVAVQKDVTAQQLNEYLFSKNIIANHLMRHRGNLESHFLSMLGHHR